jgi:hypothetical protein
VRRPALVARPRQEDRQAGRRSDLRQRSVIQNRDEDGLGALLLDPGGIACSRNPGDQRDAVAFGNRLTETPARVHRRRFFTIASPTRAEF